jgi:uncharacterized membrane protein HdeD (DUF308 family)
LAYCILPALSQSTEYRFVPGVQAEKRGEARDLLTGKARDGTSSTHNHQVTITHAKDNIMTNSPSGPLEAVAKKIGSLWWTLVVVGVVWIVIGFVILRFNNSSVVIISIVFGIMVLLAAAGEFFRAAVTPGGWRVWHVIFAILLVVGAIIIFVHPGATFVSLTLVTGIFFVFVGTFDMISSLFATALPGWWVQFVTGVAEVFLGFLASWSFSSSAFVLVTYVSLGAIVRGVSEIGAGFAVRGAAKSAE